MQTFDNGVPYSGAHTKRMFKNNFFLIALGSPFSLTFSAAITPPAALSEKRGKTYSLFLNGLSDFNTLFLLCQHFF